MVSRELHGLRELLSLWPQMRFTGIIILLAFLFVQTAAQAQGNVRDSSLFMTMISPSYSFQIPAGDMRDRFGANSNIGVNVLVKRPSNWLFGFEGSFLFGNNVNQDNLIHGLINDDGTVTDPFGDPAQLLFFERGWTATFAFGKLIDRVGPNPNCGILIKFGFGYMQHKIRIEHQNNEIPQLEGDYLKGYDRLTGGFLMTQFLGYQHLSNNRLTNFFFGFEFSQGFTTDLRSYNIDTRSKSEGARFDALTGFRAGWTLPIYRRAPADLYFH